MLRIRVQSIVVLTLVMVCGWWTPASGQSNAVQAVAQLYRDYAWEAVVEEPDGAGRYLVEQPRQVLSRYFDEELVTLLLKDHECARTTKGVCKLDFSPLWASQAPGASELKVTATNDPAVVSVSFRTPGEKNPTTLSYRMRQTAAGWRVRDISYDAKTSLLSLLR